MSASQLWRLSPAAWKREHELAIGPIEETPWIRFTGRGQWKALVRAGSLLLGRTYYHPVYAVREVIVISDVTGREQEGMAYGLGAVTLYV